MRNDPSTLPMPQRAQDIVTEARRRLASGGGKASQLPAMIQKVTEEFRYKDNQQLQGRDSRNALQMPNNMEAYIDKVLGMSSLGDPAKASQAPAGGGYAQTPDTMEVPQGRDTSDLDPEQEQQAAAVVADGERKGLPIGDIAAGLAGIMGVYAATRYLMNRYGKGSGNTPAGDAAKVASGQSAVDDTIDAVDGKKPGTAVEPYDPGMSPVDETPKQVEGTGKQGRLQGPNKQITGPADPSMQQPDQAQLPPPEQQQLAGPEEQKLLAGPRSAVDESIDATMGGDSYNVDQVIEDRVAEGHRPPTNQIRGNVGLAPEVSPEMRQAVIEKAQSLPPEEGMRLLQQFGIVPADDAARSAIEGTGNAGRSLQSRAKGVAKEAAKSAIRKAM